MAGENIFLSSRTLSVSKSGKSLIFMLLFLFLLSSLCSENSSDGVSVFFFFFPATRWHGESSLGAAVSSRWASASPPWRLTVGRPVVQEVGRHFPFTFDLDHAAALQHVTFVCQHLVEVRGHLWGV